MKKLKDIIKELTLRNRTLRAVSLQNHLQNTWQKLFPGSLAQHAHPSALVKGTLIVETTSPAWAQQVRFMSPEVIEKLKGTKLKIKKIKCVIAEESFAEPAKKEQLLFWKRENSLAKDNALRITDLRTKQKQLTSTRMKKGWQQCPACGSMFEGQCMSCAIQKVAELTAALRQLLQEAPWLKFEEAKKEIKELTLALFAKTKKMLVDETRNKLKVLTRKFSKSSPAAEAKAEINRLGLYCASLKTGLTPKDIDDKILQDIMGENIYSILKRKS